MKEQRPMAAAPGRILIVEDSPAQAEQLKSILERHGYGVTVAENGVQALARLAEHKPDIVLSDIVMSEMDGYELCRRIQADPGLNDIPVVLLTTLADTLEVLEGLSCGADSLITKPYSENYLLAQVAHILSGSLRLAGSGVQEKVEIEWATTRRVVNVDRRKTINLLIATSEAAVLKNKELLKTQDELRLLNERLEDRVAERTVELASEIAVRRRAEKALALQLRIADIFLRFPEDEMFDKVLKVVIDVMNSPFGVFGYLDEAGALVVPTMTGQVGDKSQIPGKTSRFPRETWGEDSWCRSIREKRTIHSNQPSTNVPEGHVAIQRHICVPILLQGEVIGNIEVANKETDYTESDFSTLENIAEQIAPVLSARLQHKRDVEALRRSEARFRKVFNESPLGIALVDEGLHPVQANGALCAMLGYTAEELAALTIPQVILPEEGGMDMWRADRYLQGEPECLAREVRFLKKTGETVWVQLTTTLHSEQEWKSAVLGIFQDITERKKSLELIRNILENVDQGFVILDRDFHILMANRAYCEQCKVPADAVIGRHCYEISHKATAPCDGTQHECAVKMAFTTGQTHETVHTHPGAAGENRTIQTKAYPFQRDETGRVLTVIETHIDTTEKLQLEEQLRQAQKMESVGTLAGGIAHDFNNILGVITGYGDLTRTKMSPDDPLRRNLEIMLEAAGRAAHLTRSLLSFSRKQIMERRPEDLNQLIKRVGKFLVRVIGEDVEFTMRLSGEEIPVFVDSPQIEQVLMNLATNARDAMTGDGTLTITTERVSLNREAAAELGCDKPGSYALITVADTGFGMSEEVRRRIFEPFFTTKEVGKGTGLGLAVAYGIIKQHDGAITVQSESGRGATFKILLPLVAFGAVEEQKPVRPLEYRGGAETILLAEDNELLRATTVEVLRSFGYTAIEACDGEEAVRLFRENSGRVQLCLFDLLMPRKSGLEAFAEVRKIKPDAKVLFTSGFALETLRQKGLFEEGMQIIHKPSLPADLLKKIRDVLDHGAAGRDE